MDERMDGLGLEKKEAGVRIGIRTRARNGTRIRIRISP